MTFSEPAPKSELEANKELLDDNARKFIVESLDDAVLMSESTNYLLITDWLEMGSDSEKKLAFKKYKNGDIQILLISKLTSEQGRVSRKEKISEDEYRLFLGDTIRHVEKVRHEFDYVQGSVCFELKYDVFEDSHLRILEVDAKNDDERAAFKPDGFPGKLSEVTGDLRYYGYRVADVLND